jgi:hypothetical protein
MPCDTADAGSCCDIPKDGIRTFDAESDCIVPKLNKITELSWSMSEDIE